MIAQADDDASAHCGEEHPERVRSGEACTEKPGEPRHRELRWQRGDGDREDRVQIADRIPPGVGLFEARDNRFPASSTAPSWYGLQTRQHYRL